MFMTTTTEFRGTKYQEDLSTVAIAKAVRADVKAAIADGELPKGIKVSVTCQSFAGGSSISATIKAFPGKVLNPARVYGDAIGFWEQRSRLLYTQPVSRAVAVLESILKSYQRDDSDSMTDYFNCNFYDHVDVRCDTAAERAALDASPELADLRVTKAMNPAAVYDTLESYDLSAGKARL